MQVCLAKSICHPAPYQAIRFAQASRVSHAPEKAFGWTHLGSWQT